MAYGVPEPTYLQGTATMSYAPYNLALQKQYEADVWKARQPFLLQQQQWQRGQGLKGEYETAYTAAKEANIKRYEEILAGYKTRYGTTMEGLAKTREEVMSGLEGMGKEELAGIERRYTKERASTAQQLISSGLHSTTVAPAVQAGVTRREGYAVGEAQERLRRERLGYLQQLSAQELLAQTGLKKEELDFMERRTDEYPSESLYVQLMQGLGST